MIDLYKTIQDLYAEKEKLQRVIASLVDLQRGVGGDIPLIPKSGKRRGRKSMGDEERQMVSVRMKKYWSVRRHSALANEALADLTFEPSDPDDKDFNASLARVSQGDSATHP